MINLQRVKFDTIRTLPFGSISASYAVLGTPLTFPCRIALFTNGTNGTLLFSDDGTNDKVFLLSNSSVVLDLNTNRVENQLYWVLIPGTQIYVKYVSAPSSGGVYLSILGDQTE